MSHEVMLVDDSSMMRTILATMLRKYPEFSIVDSAVNGRDALDKIKNHPALALILLDIEMPEMDGFEFLRFAKLQSNAKIIILSSVALSGSSYAAKARALGADAIVSKPSGAVSFDLAEKCGDLLIQTMRTLVSQ
ncbi:MAG: hypothetical protein RIQ52_382 [Pseudomonadota bacterium]|jgi:chemotaxis response regulator CheB